MGGAGEGLLTCLHKCDSIIRNHKEQNMSTYIFDFDGTLGDSMPYFSESVLTALKQNNIDYPEDIIKIITPLGYKGSARYFIEEFGLPYTEEELISSMHETLYIAYRDKIILKPGVEEYLKKLREEGHALYVLTASPFRMVSAVLKRCGVFDLFEKVWSCEDFNMTKGDPEIYRVAVKRAGSRMEDAFFFDDNLEAIRTAVSAGIYTIGVYDKVSEEYLDEIKEIANRFIYSFEEMM